jgi:ribosome silencing factor RsfS/YbeB/iojap
LNRLTGRSKLIRPKSAPPAKRTRAKTTSAKATSAKTAAPPKVKTPPKGKAVPKRSSPASAARKSSAKKAATVEPSLLALVRASLEDDKAEDIVVIDLGGRSSLTDTLVIASGRSSRHVAATAEHLVRRLKEAGYGTRPTDGLAQGDWVLVDAGDVIVHLFRPEVRQYYDLEGMWRVPEPERAAR